MAERLTYKVNQSELAMVQGDITRQATDAIVNAANSSLMGGGGVDGAIHRTGGPAILEECKQIVASHSPLPTGLAVITTAGKMPSRHVIHTVGPVWQGGSRGEADLLASAYGKSLELAAAEKLASVSFPSISTGAYGYPVDRAARVALKEVASFLGKTTSIKQVVFVLFDAHTYEAYAAALREIQEGKF